MVDQLTSPDVAPRRRGVGVTVAAIPTTAVHRLLTALAAVIVVQRLLPSWNYLIAHHPAVGVAYGLTFVLVLAALAVALAARDHRWLRRADVTVLAVAAVNVVVSFHATFGGRVRMNYDESILISRAARALAAGHSPYAESWPHAIVRGRTLLFDGTIADRFGYPPLAAVVDAGVHRVLPGVEPTTFVALVALLACAGIAWTVLPSHLRPLAVIAVLTITPLPFLAANGYPIVVGMPFVLVAVWRWADTGAGGRLGARGVAQAVCLGCAAASQQLVWFLAAFLLVGIWRLRRGELDRCPALAVTARYAGLAALAFAVIDAPFAVWTPTAWWHGILAPLRQHAFFDGPGASNLSLHLVHGGGDLGLYGTAAAVAAATLLVAVAVFPRQLGPAAVVLPVVAFWLSLRSQSIYYATFAPAVLVALATVPRERFDTAAPLATRRLVRLGVPALGALVAAGCVVAAVASPAPLTVAVTHEVRVGGDVVRLDLRLRNTGDAAVEPSFTVLRHSAPLPFWHVLHGPRRLAPGRTARYVIAPARGSVLPAGRAARVCVVSDNPQTLGTAVLPTR